MKRFHLFSSAFHTYEEYNIEGAYNGSFDTLQEAKDNINTPLPKRTGEIMETQSDGSLQRVACFLDGDWFDVSDGTPNHQR